MKSKVQKVTALFLALSFTLFSSGSLLAAEPPGPPKISSSDDRRDSFDPGALALSSHVPAEAIDPRITLELKGVDILDVLRILAQRSEMNIVAGKNVQGQVTIYLKDVLIREALNTILSSLDLAYEKQEGIVKVMTDKEYELLHGKPFRDLRRTKAFKMRHADPKAVQQVIRQLKGPTGKVILDERTNTLIVSDAPEILKEIAAAIRELDEPLVTNVFKLQYGSAADIEPQLQAYVTPENGILKVDKRSNQVSVTDRKEKVDRLAEIIRAFDVRPPQVLIEAQVIEVTLFDAFRYGIDWAYVRDKLGTQFNGVNFQPQFDVSAPGSDLGSGTLSTFTVGGTRFTKGLSNTIISILQNIGKTNTLSAPRLTVLNNEEAKLVDATRQPYVTSTVSQAQTSSATADAVQFIDVGVTLTVVPTISDNNTIVLKLKPEVSASNSNFTYNTASAQVTTAFARTIPVVSSQSLETTVIVKSGETLIVGGLIKDKESKTLRKLPFLGDLPWIGSLFRSETNDFRKTELVIFLTPYLVSGDAATDEYGKYLNAEGNFIDFDKVGGFDYALGQKHSQGPFRLDNRPYWRLDESAFPRYFPPKDVYTRSEPYRGHRNEFEGLMEGKFLPEKHLFLKAYRDRLGEEVGRVLQSSELMKGLQGETQLALLLRRDGVLEDISFVDEGAVKDRKLRRAVLQTIRERSPFPEFPKGLDSEKELFDLRFEFSKGENPEPADSASGSQEPASVGDSSQASHEMIAHESSRQPQSLQ